MNLRCITGLEITLQEFKTDKTILACARDDGFLQITGQKSKYKALVTCKFTKIYQKWI